MFVPLRSVQAAEVTDGLSNTMLLSERPTASWKGDGKEWHWWADTPLATPGSGPSFRSTPSKWSPTILNMTISNPTPRPRRASIPAAQLRLADGSVRFIRDTIDIWPVDLTTGYPIGVSQDANGFYHLAAGVKFGVYQQLSTRAGDEIIAPGSY